MWCWASRRKGEKAASSFAAERICGMFADELPALPTYLFLSRIMKLLSRSLFSLGLLFAGTGMMCAQGPPAAVKAETFRVRSAPFDETIQTVGTLRANEAVTLVAESSNRLAKVLCAEGTQVEAGAVLFQLDDAELRSELQEIESRLALALANKQRAEELLPSKAISQLEADVASAEWRVLDAQKQTKLVQIARAKIVAPFAGKLGTRKVSEGAYLTPSLPLIDLQDLSRIKVDISLPERYVPVIKEKQKFTFTVAGQGQVREGEITVIEPVIDPRTRSLFVTGVCTKPEGLVPGGFADVTIPIAAAASSLMVPTQAIVPSPRGHGVYLIIDGKAQFRDVTIGTRTEQQVQILRGLAEGDVVATTNLNRIRPGVEVSIVTAP
jgi:membrane fusion protein (multidrug efflux system)